MILRQDQWYLGYSQILTDCRPDNDGATGSALILCNADVDAMCAARILSYMLRADGISYHLVPCMSYSQLQKALARKKTDDVRAVVLLNMGASRNLSRLFESDDEQQSQPFLDPSVKVYVVDFRRPVHLANVHAGENVVVFWDSTQRDEDIPSDGDNLSGNESESSSDGGDDDDDDTSSDEGEQEFAGEDSMEQDDDGEHQFRGDEVTENDAGDAMVVENPQGGDDESVGRTRQAKSARGEDQADYDGDREDEVLDAEDEDLVDEEDADNRSGDMNDVPPTQQSQIPSQTPRELHNMRREKLRTYYSSGTFYGSPASYVAYCVCTQLRFGDIGDLLWLACVGITDAFLHSRLDVLGYAQFAMFLRQHCTRLFPNDMYHRVENASYAEHLTGLNGSRAADTNDLTKIGFSDSGKILSEPDFRFFLLRHNSLLDAMYLSDYVSTRLQLTTAKGRHKLQELLAKMGYPLEECNQPFHFMKPSLRRRLKDQMNLYCEDYGLDNFEYTSFLRIVGYNSMLSAADTSYAVTALLEVDRSTTKNIASNGESAGEAELIQSFNYAFDALNSNDSSTGNVSGFAGEGSNVSNLVNGGSLSGASGLGAGIILATQVQKTIMETAASLIERNAITRLEYFRHAYIRCTNQSDRDQAAANDIVIPAGQRTSEEQDHHIFDKPLALTRLAQYLIELNRVNGKWVGRNASPTVLVLAAEKPRTNTYLVVAYEYAEEPGHFVRNHFGKNFELAAQSMQGNFLFDSFDTNVVEVSAKDVDRFLQQLSYLMETTENL